MKKYFNKIEQKNQTMNQSNTVKETRLSIFSKKAIEYLILTVFLLVPLWISTGYSLALAKSNLFQILVYLMLFFSAIRLFEIKKVEIKLNTINILILCWFFSMILATIFSPDRGIAFWGNHIRFEGLKQFIFYFIFYFILTSVLNKKLINQSISLLIYSSMIICAYAISQSLGHYIFSVPFEFQIEGGINRAFATFGNPIMLASYLAVLLPLTYYNYLKVDKSNKLIKYLFLFIICLQLYTIIITYTRGPLIALIMGIGLYLLINIYLGKIKWLKITSTLIAIVLLSSIILVNIFSSSIKTNSSNPIVSRFISVLSLKNSFQNRIIIWQSLTKPIKDRIWFGFGSDVYDEYSLSKKYFNPAMFTLGGGELRIDKAHNLILDSLLSFGIFATLILLAILIELLILLIKKIKSTNIDLEKSYFSLLLVSVTIFFVANLSAFPQISDYILLFFIIALVGLYREPEKVNNLKINDFKGNIILYFALGLVFMLTFYLLTYSQSKAEKNDLLADKYLKIGNFKVEEQYSQKAYNKNSRFFQYSRKLIESQLSQNSDDKINQAIEISQILIKNRPQEIQNWIMLAKSYNEKGLKNDDFFTKADETIDLALDKFGCQLELYQEKIRELVTRGKLSEINDVIIDANKSTNYKGKNYYSNYYIFGATEGLIKKEDYQNAINFITDNWDSSDSNSDDNKYWYLGFSYYKLKDITNAETTLNKCTEFKKNDLNCYKSLIVLFYEQKNWDKVREYIARTSKIYPQVAEEYSKSLDNIINNSK